MNSVNLNVCISLLLTLTSCKTTTYLTQSSFQHKPDIGTEKIDCIFSDDVFYSTADYTLLQCSKSPEDIFFIPGRLVVEYDMAATPLMLAQYIGNKHVNIITKFTYESQKFMAAAEYIRHINSNYRLHILPINSINISNSTAIPDKHISYSGTTTYNFFEGYIIFQIQGNKQIDLMRRIFLDSAGFRMIYESKYLINRDGVLIQKKLEIPIYINNINF